MRVRFAIGLLLLLVGLAACLRAVPPVVPETPRNDADEAGAVTLPPDFEDTLVAEVSAPIDVAWTPDGRMLIPTKKGELWIYQDGALLAGPSLDLSGVMCMNGERSMGDVAVHPDFATNRFIYLYYTFDKPGDASCAEDETDGPVNRLSRFVLPDSNVIDPASEQVLFDTPPLFRDHHNAGDVEFGSDGYLYVSVGDGGGQRFDWPQDLGNLFGTIVRLTPDGGIPADNPFTGADSARCHLDGVPPPGSPADTKCQEIYAYGLRNPWRFALDPNTSEPRIFVNDVGQHTWEEISEILEPGANLGWPEREGPCVTDSDTDCDPPAGLLDPIHWYHHEAPDGGAVTGGAFVPDGVWPAEYQGAYMFADYVFGKMYKLMPGGSGCRGCSPPTSAVTVTEFLDAPRVVSMRFGPPSDAQALYYVSREGGEIRRIAYTGSANRAPVAAIDTDRVSGDPPLTVQFDGSGSSDPDGDPLSFAWDFDGDGTVDATDLVQPSHTYTADGTYHARLTVTDDNGAAHSATVRIDVGNTPPVPVIELPVDGATFAVGQRLDLLGSATDVEDGTLGDLDLTWEVRQHHNTHWHPYLDPTPGNNLQVVAPEPEELFAAGTSHLEILLTATDSAGLSATVSRLVMPRIVELDFTSDPSGLTLLLDDSPVVTPATVLSWEDHPLRANAPDQNDADGQGWNWSAWSDGGDQAHEIVVPATSPAEPYHATFQQGTGGPGVPGDPLLFAPTDDATVRQDRPDRNLGSEPLLEVDGDSKKDTLLRFVVQGLNGRPVARATLRLYVDNSSPDGGTGQGAASDWSETSVTWNSAPAPLGPPLESLGSVNVGEWVELDVTALVTGDGPMSVRLSSTNRNGADYFAKENGALTPELVVVPGGPPPPTLTVSPSILTVTEGDGGTPFSADLQNSSDPITWTLSGPGSLSTTSGATTVYTPPAAGGAGSATLTASASGVQDSAEITVEAAPQPSLTVSPPTLTVVEGDPGSTFTATLQNASDPIAWTLSGPGGLSTTSGATTVYTPPATGAPTSATLTASAGALSDAASITIEAKPPPSLTVTPTTLTVVEGDGGTTFSATLLNSSDPITWTLSGPGGLSTTSGATTVYTPPATGAPTSATLTASAAGVSDVATITIEAAPPPSLTLTPTTLTTAVGDAGTTFTATLENSSDAIAWTLVGPGTLSPGTAGTSAGASSGSTDSVVYTPPATGNGGNATLTAAGGGVSDQASITVTDAPPPPSTLTFTPTDDAVVREDRPDRNLGSETLLEVDGSPVKHTLLRFDVQGLNGRTVARVTLRLYVDNSSSEGGAVRRTSAVWSENTVTWANAPAPYAPELGSLGSVRAGEWAELDVTGLVTGDGPVSVRLFSSNRNGADYFAKENGSLVPELVVVTQ